MNLLLLVGLLQAELLRPVDQEQGIEIGVLVETVAGAPVFSWRATEARVMASNTKLFTTAAILCSLPADWRWQTQVYWDGSRLWVEGGGDPSLRKTETSDWAALFLDRCASWMQELDVRWIEEVVLDDRSWLGPARHPLWPAEQWQQVWCAPISALSIQGNCMQLNMKPGGSLKLIPNLGAEFRPQFRNLGPGRPFSAWWNGSGVLMVRGDASRGGSANLAVPSSQRMFASWFVSGLKKRGIAVAAQRWAEGTETVDPASQQKAFPSAWTLADAVVVANKDSDNFVAESLLRTLALAKDLPGSAASGLQAMDAVMADLKIEGEYSFADGSGLARQSLVPVNQASPQAVCSLLRSMAHHPAGPVYFDSLPIGGADGRLSNRFQSDVFAGQRVHAKTGWIHGASSLAGYLLAPDDSILVFSLVVNYEKDGTARTNNRRFKVLQEAVLERVLKQWSPS